MTHRSSHIIIHKLTDTVSMDPASTTSKVQAWYVPAAALVIGLVLGLLF